MRRLLNLLQAIGRSPIVWGILASAGFYGLIQADGLGGQSVRRYFASHPVEYAETVMFFVGLAVLLLKLMDVLAQYPTLSRPILPPASAAGRAAGDCGVLLDRLAGLPGSRQSECLVRRLRDAVEHVRRRGSAEMLEEHLGYLADLEAARQHASYALVRVIIWAIPILGFLGTVIGITLAIANLAPDALEQSLPDVTAGLGVAFDTTALALGLSIVLMFAQYVTDRAEGALLAEVDRRAAAELAGRFERISATPDGQLAAVRQMAEMVLEATGRLVRRQAEFWQASMETAAAQWSRMGEAVGDRLQAALGTALAESLKTHGRQLAAVQEAVAVENRRHWEQVQQTHLENTRVLTSLQTAVVEQADVLARAVDAAGEVARLEDALNRNLGALAGARHFEQTVMSLAAAIHLLSARLADDPADVHPVQLEPDRGQSQAA